MARAKPAATQKQAHRKAKKERTIAENIVYGAAITCFPISMLFTKNTANYYYTSLYNARMFLSSHAVLPLLRISSRRFPHPGPLRPDGPGMLQALLIARPVAFHHIIKFRPV